MDGIGIDLDLIRDCGKRVRAMYSADRIRAYSAALIGFGGQRVPYGHASRLAIQVDATPREVARNTSRDRALLVYVGYTDSDSPGVFFTSSDTSSDDGCFLHLRFGIAPPFVLLPSETLFARAVDFIAGRVYVSSEWF